MLRSGSPSFRHSGQSPLRGCRGPNQHTPRRSRDTSPASIQELCYLYSLYHRLHRGCHHLCGSCSPHPSGVEGLLHSSSLHMLQFAHGPLDTEQAPACFTLSYLDNTIEPTLLLPPPCCYVQYVNVEEIPVSNWDMGAEICAVWHTDNKETLKFLRMTKGKSEHLLALLPMNDKRASDLGRCFHPALKFLSYLNP